MGYDEHNNNWRGASWTEGREERREGGWDMGGRRGEEREDDWAGVRRGREEEEEEVGGGEGEELENRFLDQLMVDLDGTPGAGGGRGRGGERSPPPPPPTRRTGRSLSCSFSFHPPTYFLV